jgi:acyl carrier protein
MADDLEERIRHFVSETGRVPPTDVTSATTLTDELGIDGDDAVEFFQAFEKEFEVDLSDLWLKWSHFFGSEAWGLVGTLVCLTGFILGGMLLWLAERKIGFSLPGWLEFTFMGVVGLVLCYFAARIFVKPLKQISVADLVASARRRAW